MKSSALWLLAACTPSLSVPDAAQLQCVRNADCPAKLLCQTTTQRCVAAAAIDTTPPKLALAVAANPQIVVLTFNEPIAAPAAILAANYTTLPALSIDSASLDADQQTVVLAVHGQQSGQAYVVTAQNVTDLSGNVITASGDQASFAGVAAAPDTSAPEAIAPEAGARQFSPSEVTVGWTLRSGAASYTVDVAYDAAFTHLLAESPYLLIAASAEDTPPTSVAIATPTAATYYWRVRSDITIAGAYGGSFFETLGDTSYVYCPASTTTCDDTGRAGNLSNPFQTINRALADAKEHGIGEVRVADRGGGVAYPELVTVLGGSALRGGYGPDFSDASQQSGTFVSRIASGGTYSLYADGVSQPTLIDGFHIDGGTANVVHAVQLSNCTAALTLSNDVVTGGTNVTTESIAVQVTAENGLIGAAPGPIFVNDTLTGSDGPIDSYALSAISGNVSVSHSTLHGGVPTGSSYGFYADYSSGAPGATLTDNDISSPGVHAANSVAVYISGGANLRITSNKIRGGSGGVNLQAQDSVVANNDICAGVTGVSVARSWVVNNTICTGDIDRDAQPAPFFAVADLGGGSIVANNILFGRSSGTTCYRASGTGLTFENNLLFDCTTLVETKSGTVLAIADVNTASEYGTPVSVVGGNITDAGAESYFVDFADFTGGDLHLLPATPAAIRLGGLDAGSASYGTVTDDFDHAPRTCPVPGSNCYSMGAYEED